MSAAAATTSQSEVGDPLPAPAAINTSAALPVGIKSLRPPAPVMPGPENAPTRNERDGERGDAAERDSHGTEPRQRQPPVRFSRRSHLKEPEHGEASGEECTLP